ncbi:Clp protease N-terminal domain-containing protein, partial [Bacillus pumilus]|uniref:Clp protease N-terminal domain-containing protein n=1 Tax=Bacillus pumilus TaxID=1408 RepID=UPI003315F777
MAINFNKLTLKSQEALQRSQEIASENSNQQIEPEHIFEALASDPAGIVTSILAKLGANKDSILSNNKEFINSFPKVSGANSGDPVLSRNSTDVLDSAFKEASAMKDEFVSAEHILLGIAENLKSKISNLLRNNGV